MKNPLKKWLSISRKIAIIQSSVILFIIYYLIMLPLSLLMKLFFSKQLEGQQSIKNNNGSYWKSRKKINQDLTFAYEQ
jgi:hypothetical protein